MSRPRYNTRQPRQHGSSAGDSDTVRISKQLSYILRHGAQKERIPIRPDGFILLTDLRKYHKLRDLDLDTLNHITATSDKQRFTLAQDPVTDAWMIKANQGHSIASVDVELEHITDPADIPVVLHGTFSHKWDQIRSSGGLSRMNRNHIHFAPGRPGESGVISGMRSSCDVFIYIDAAACIRDGIPFHRSPNNVILSEGIDGTIPLSYFLKVERSNGEQMYP